MASQDDRIYSIQMEMQRLNNLKRTLRDREKSLDARRAYIGSANTAPTNNIKTLKGALEASLPSYMVPGNVGGVNEVCWPFYFNVTIDLGDDPSITSNTYARSYFQVDQEAAFILQSITRSHMTNAAGQSATITAPIQIDLIDRQSSRRFSNEPIPLQMFGAESLASILPTGMYIQPNAFLDVQANGIPELAQDFNGSGQFTLTFFGYRIRTEDAGKVLSTIFTPIA